MMKIFLIRHGETTGDVENRYGGDYEDHLTSQGRKESEIAAKDLEKRNIDLLYHSPRIRAVETAEIISKKLKIGMSEELDFRERNAYGILTGMKKEEAAKKYPAEVEKVKKDKLRHNVKGSEDYDSFRKRIIEAFNKLVSEKHSSIAIVTHGGPISCLTREVFRFGEFKEIGDCMIMEIELKDGEYKLIELTRAELEK